MRILIIEDKEDLAKAMARLLERRLDAEVSFRLDASSARDEMDKGGVDVVLLDYHLPDTDCLSFLDELRGREDPPPVIVITGSSLETVRGEAVARGARGCVCKDERLPETLPAAVREALARDVER